MYLDRAGERVCRPGANILLVYSGNDCNAWLSEAELAAHVIQMREASHVKHVFNRWISSSHDMILILIGTVMISTIAYPVSTLACTLGRGEPRRQPAHCHLPSLNKGGQKAQAPHNNMHQCKSIDIIVALLNEHAIA